MNERSQFPIYLAAAVCLLLPMRAASAGLETQHARTRDLCFDWRFTKGDPTGAEKSDFQDSGWAEVQLPHDWSIGGPKAEKNPGDTKNGFFPGGVGWYRKHIRFSPSDEGKKIFVDFDGVYQNSEVWINGHSLGRRPNGFISFQLDLTPYVKFGQDNVLAVRVDNSDQPNCRWYTGSGIYRDVRLTVTDKLHVNSWGTYVTTPRISKEKATVRVRTEIQNSDSQPRRCTLVTRVIDPDENVVAERIVTDQILAQSEHAFDQEVQIPDPKLWSIDYPRMYTVATLVRDEHGICDHYTTPFGIRSACFDKDRGFVLNGEPLKLKGVCIHQDAGSLGVAVPKRAWERRLAILQSIGCNAIRASHNPPSPEMLNLCDRMGFLVIDEAFDKWDAPYGQWFEDWWQADLTDTIRRDRNHPSVIMWSVGNELSDQGKPKFVEQLKKLVVLSHQVDPTRPVTCALKPAKKVTSREENAKIVTAIAKSMDVLSCNYQEQWFEDYRKANPEVIIVASESYPYYRGKGLTYKAFEPLNPWLEADRHGYVAGAFYWTGIDYLGEAEDGWPSHGWNCSLIDTCGYVRPFAYLQKSLWTSEPMVHIAAVNDSLDVPAATKDHWGWPKMDSHWNLPQLRGRCVKVATFTNCEAVELLMNGKSMGCKQLKDFPDKMITWCIPYKSGRIEARGFVHGHVETTHVLRTAGKAAKIGLAADRATIRADGRDLCYVDVEITDRCGTVVPSAKQQIRFTIDGPGAIIGVDNGDLRSMESFKATKRSAFHGKAQVVVQAMENTGAMVLHAYADGLPGAQVKIEAR